MDSETAASAVLQRRSRFDFTPEVIASYPTPNYVNPVTRGPTLYIFNSIFFTFMLSCVALRLYARIWIRRWFGLDDVFILCAVVGAVGVTACTMLGFHEYGWDRHIYDVKMNLLAPSGQILFASKLLWSFTSNAVRASVMCLYYRLLEHVGAAQHRWILHVNSVFILGLFVSSEATTVFACTPIKAVWTFPVPLDSKCIDNGTAVFTFAVLNTLSEAIVAALPLPIILSLNLGSHQRKVSVGLLCGGFFVVIVGCVRTYYVWTTLATHDPTWWAQPHWICSEVEMDVAIVCACVPAITPVLKRALGGGWKPANQIGPSSLPSREKFRAYRARSLFDKLKEQTSFTGLSISTNRSNASNRRLNTVKNIDLEGISNDGFGYSVTITTGRGTVVKRRWDIRNKTWHYYPEQPISEVEDDSSLTRESRKRSLFSQGSKLEKSVPNTTTKELGNPIMEVRTEKSFDVRESFHSEHFDRGFDYRNPFRLGMPGKYEGDIEIALQIPEIEANDWSLFDGEVNRRMAARILPEAEVRHERSISREEVTRGSPAMPARVVSKRSYTSYDAQRHAVLQRRRSLDSTTSRTSSNRVLVMHRISHSHSNIHIGVLPSPSTLDLNTFSNSFMWSNTPSPENASTATYATAATRRAEVRSEAEYEKRDTGPVASATANNTVGHGRTGQSRNLHPPAELLHEEISDDEFSLPLQRPSPRNSGYEQARSKSTGMVPIIQIREYE